MTMTNSIILSNSTGDRQRWDDYVRASPWGHLMQSWAWGEFKAALGWRVYRVALSREDALVAGAQLLLKPLPWLPFTIAYIPKGPVADLDNKALMDTLWDAVHQVAREQRAIFLKIEPNALHSPAIQTHLEQQGFQSTLQTNQPRSTLVIDLSPSEEELLYNMRKTTRKLVRRAKREGVEILEGDKSDLVAFYRVIAATGDVKDIPVHEKLFYEEAWRALSTTASIKLFLAKYQDQIVAAKMVTAFGNRSMHLWGGTGPTGRDIYASYLIQWHAIKWARRQGYAYCDLWGIPDEVGALDAADEDIPKDRHDGLWGVYTFKRGFGGEIEYYVGAYDYAYRPWLYRLGMQILGKSRSVDIISSWLEKLSQ